MASHSHIPPWTGIQRSEKADLLLEWAILRLPLYLDFDHFLSRGMDSGIRCWADIGMETALFDSAGSDCGFLATSGVLLLIPLTLRHCCLCMSIPSRRNNLLIAMQRRIEKQALDWVHVCSAQPLRSWAWLPMHRRTIVPSRTDSVRL